MAENLNLSTRVGMNTTPLVRAVGTAKKQLQSLNKDLRNQKAAFKDVGMGSQELADREKLLTQAIKQQSSYLKQKEADYEKVKNSIKDMNNMTAKEVNALNKARNAVSKEQYALRGFKNELGRVKSEQQQLTSSTTRLATETKKQEVNTKRVASYWRQLGHEGKALQAEYKGLASQTAKYSAAIDKEEANLKQLKNTYSANSRVIQQQEQKIKGLVSEQSRLYSSQEKARVAMQKAGNAASAASNKVKRLGTSYKEAGRNMMGIGRSMAASVSLPVSLALGGAIKSTVEWEDALSNVAKTTNASEGQMAKYGDSIRNMARSMPESQSTLANTMATAAQLGISGGKNLERFTKVATQMGVATDMSAEESSQAMAKFANATGKPKSDFNKLGSTVVQLGNNMAAQEGNIMDFAQRLAGSATVAGMGQKDIIGLSAAMASVGISAEAGGSSMSKVLTKMNNAVKDGGEKLNQFAAASGMSASEFSAQWEKDPYKALMAFEQGLAKQNKSGKNVNDTLKQLGITELRERDTVLRLANGNEQLTKARKNADKGFKEGIALNQEAETKYKTLGNQMKIFMNNLRDLGISIGGALAPMITFIMKGLTPLIQMISHAPAPIRAMIGIFGVLAAATGPVIIGLGAMVAAFGAITSSTTIMAVLGAIKGAFVAVGTAIAGISAPVWIAIGAIAAIGTAFVIAYKKSETFRNIVNGALDSVVAGFKMAWGAIKNVGVMIGSFIFTNIIQPIQQFSQKILGEIQAFWSANGPMIMQAITNIWNVAQPMLMAMFNLFKTVFGGILKIVVSVLSALWQVAQPILTAFGNVFMAFWDYIVLSFKNAWNVIKGVVQGALDIILGIVQIFGGIFTGNWSAVWQGIKQVTSGIIGIIVSVVRGLWTSIINIFGLFGTIIKNIWLGIWGALKGIVMGALGIIVTTAKVSLSNLSAFFSFIWTSIKTVAMIAWNGIKFVILTPIRSLINWFRIQLPALKALFTIIWTGIKNVTMIIVRGLVTGIRLLFSGLKAFISFIFNTIKTVILTIWRAIKAVVLTVVRGLVTGIRMSFTGLKAFVTIVFNAIKTVAIVIWNAIKIRVVGAARAIWRLVVAAFNALKAGVVRIFNAIRTIAIAVWTAIKNRIVALARSIWRLVVSAFTALKNAVIRIFSAIRNFAIRVWTIIKNRVVGLARSLKNIVTSIFNALKGATTRIFNAIKNFAIRVWTTVKNKVVSLARSLKNSVTGAWNSLKGNTTRIFNSVKGFMSNTWNKIRSIVVSVATGMKNKTVGIFNKMKDAIKGVTDKIKGFFNSMLGGVEKGLNGLIKGVNWVGEKLNMDPLPKVKLHTGTESTHTRNVVTNGKINRDTFATVGDKGRGNGPGGFRHEAIKYPNGKMAITPNRDTTAFLPKGSSVMNGAQTHSMLSNSPAFANGTLPKFSNGSLSNKKPKKKKKGDNVFGDAWDKTKEGTKVVSGKVVEGGKAVVNKTLETAAKGKKWLDDKVGDVMDWIEKPGKLLDKVLEGFGINLDSFGISKSAKLPFDMMKGMFGKLKKAAIDTFTSWMEEQGGDGDGGYIDLSKGINFPFSPNGRAPGYPFPYPHMGVDLNYVYDKLYSVASGTATAKTTAGGFGKHMWIKKGNMDYIYGHMSKFAFNGSKKVKPGDYLGVSGNTGMSSGPHLHFEVRKNGKAIDPLKWLKANDGGGGKSGKWSGDVKKALKLAGLPTSSAYVNAWKKQIQTESGGNPKAMGGTDGLADGAAKGLVQVKPGTFNAYKLPGHGNIWNGLDNLIAGMRYAKARYGKGGMLSVIGKGHGYAKGTNFAPRGWAQVHEKGGEIMNLRGGEQIIPHDVSVKALSNLLSSELFNRTQNAVYNGITSYAEQLRRQDIQRQKQQTQQNNNNANSNDIAEMKSMFNDMLYLMQKMVGASEETARNTDGILNKNDSNQQNSYENLSRQLGFDYVMSNYNTGSRV